MVHDAMLSLVNWRGDETVLDIGTGRGFLAIGAAKLLRTGTVTGIDIWRADELSGNSLENAERAVIAEKVQHRIDLKTCDAREIGFADESFDIILSLQCLHSIEEAAGRKQACAEIARVLKKGGRAVIGDRLLISEYAQELSAAGLFVSKPAPYHLRALSGMTIVTAKKP